MSMKIGNLKALYWHSFFLAVTMSFTEINTVMPALILRAGGGERLVGGLTAIMVGLPLVSQLVFAGFLSTRSRKKPYLLTGINLRVFALAAAAVAIAWIGTDYAIIPIVFVTMSLFALSGAFAGVSYTEMVGKVVVTAQLRRFFVRRQVATSAGLLISAVATRLFLGVTSFPDGYVLLFAMASGFLLIASAGFWALYEPAGEIVQKDKTQKRESDGIVRSMGKIPEILRSDANMRMLIIAVNLGALGFTAIPLVTALAHRRFELLPETAGWFVIIQVIGMLLANLVWTRLIKFGGFRFVLRAELILVALLFPFSLVASRYFPLWAYMSIYLVTGAIISAHRVGVDAILVQISPDGQRALYAGIFGAANLGTAIMPLITGMLTSALGFSPVFIGASILSLAALIPASKIWCGEWYKEV